MTANRFRFRAWDGQIEQMVYNVLPCTDRVYFVVVDEGSCKLDERWGEPEYLQSTGLCDCNGVKIFEGDVVRFIGKYHGSRVGGLRKGVVRHNPFGLRGYSVCRKTKEGYYEQAISITLGKNGDALEVLGNEFQNPELLEDKS